MSRVEGTAGASVGLVVNCYERTYREVLRSGFFEEIAAQNLRRFDEVVALINNVGDCSDARARAEALVRSGEISAYAFVADHVEAARRRARLPRRAFRRRPYLLDYGLVMPHVVSTEWLLGWDAETRLSEPANWIDPALQLMEADPHVFHVSLSWLVGGESLARETFARSGDYALNWGFSDQLFLLRRRDLVGPVYRSFAPAAMVRHAPHPYTFEYRVEAHQRAVRRCRATLTTHTYETQNQPQGVVTRTGRTWSDEVTVRTLRKVELGLINHLPKWMGPRFCKTT